MNYLFAFAASYVYIWAKATQQLQVVNFRYWRIMPMSLVMATCEVFIMVNVIRTADSFAGLALRRLGPDDHRQQKEREHVSHVNLLLVHKCAVSL